jgi:putative colanic acid biosynthesis glycosyltransferase
MRESEGPFLSIVTAVLNDIVGLQRTAASLKEQSFREFEWIVMDGASSDGSIEFMQRSENASALFITSPDLGIYDAMNKGTERASGRYMNYLNAGDTYCGSASLQLVKDEAEREGYPEVIYAGTNYEFSDGSLRYRPPREASRAIRHGMPAIHQSTFYLRSYLEKPPYDLRYRVSADYFIAARSVLGRGRALYVDKAVTVFPIGGVSTKNRRESLIDSWKIQRDVLKLPLWTRIASAVRRWLVHLAVDSLQAVRSWRARLR